MTPSESDQALRQLQALYSMTRKVLTTADEHEGAKATAQGLAAMLRPPAPPPPPAASEMAPAAAPCPEAPEGQDAGAAP